MRVLFTFCVFLAFTGNIDCICNKSALWNVTVIGHYEKGVRGETFFNKNITHLVNYYKIDIQWANLTTLCQGMISNFPRLQTLTMIGLNISELEQEAFQTPNLEQLSLTLNKLTAVKRGQFNNIKSLKNLYLSGNRIEYVEEEAFDDMPRLQKVFLDRNNIREINGNWFLNSPQIRVVQLSYNSIMYVPAGAFRHLLPGHQDIVEYFLDNNEITDISDQTIDNQQHIVLHLEHNNITQISGSVFRNLGSVYRLHLEWNQIECLYDDVLSQMDTSTMSLYMNKNPLTCNCIEKFDTLINQKLLTVDFYYDTTLQCMKMAKLKAPFLRQK